ncbi:hypothetical protein Nepgr_012785 [Nepenthes gracilis]|uniref:Cytochrome B561-related protein n=1 Tax=Nepenthes gracilis TaxID=150966 RepID=A0AAD3SHW3_NEPGR|nr:hypothetical protein Nepgr_012785 [Nepenthes gracilis]
MSGGGQRESKTGGSPSPLLQKTSKFAVYRNPALSAALTATSLRPSIPTFLFIFSLSSASAFAFLAFTLRENGIVNNFRKKNVSEEVAYILTKVIQIVVGLSFVGASFALVKAILLRRNKISTGAPVIFTSHWTKEKACLTNRQLCLMGIQPKVEMVVSESSKKPPKHKSLNASASSDSLVPVHQPVGFSNLSSRIGTDKSNSSGGKRMQSFGTPPKSPGSPSSPFVVPPASSQSPILNQFISTPWSGKWASPAREIMTEEELEQFLADVDKKITESAEKLATPPAARSGFSISSPSMMSSSANTCGTMRPLRPVRMSPGSQKFNTSPKKGEGDLPLPMAMDESIEALEHLGIYPQIELWRDHLRQWFSSVLLGPLLHKIESSHIQIMQAASKLGISITVSQVGNDLPTSGTPAIVSPLDHTKEWQPTFASDELGLLHQLRAFLVQALDVSIPKSPIANVQQSPQQNASLPIIQECVDAITEHQRLHALMKGELIKGLLPQSSIPAEYTVQRIWELAEGTCLKNYEYLGSGEAFVEGKKKWSLEPPSDCHLLLYLFCAFLEFPNWMLHVDPLSYSGAQSSKNPLFLGVLPPKERFPEKYIAVISGVPSILHPGASVIAIGRQSPPIFSLYWDKKLQFSLQGRTALWDSILLLCHRIKIGYGGIVRGIHLGSSALSILQVLESEDKDR